MFCSPPVFVRTAEVAAAELDTVLRLCKARWWEPCRDSTVLSRGTMIPRSGMIRIQSLGFSRNFFLQMSSKTSARYMSLGTWTVVVIASGARKGIRTRRYTRGAVDPPAILKEDAFAAGVPVKEALYREAAVGAPPPAGMMLVTGGGARVAMSLPALDDEAALRIFLIILDGLRCIWASVATFCLAVSGYRVRLSLWPLIDVSLESEPVVL